MAISREKKEALVAKYTEQLKASDGIIITEYRGLSVSELQELRTKIREEEGSFAVVKNTLARRALEAAGLPIPSELMVGPLGIGFCHQNLTGVAKAMTQFAKNSDLFIVKGGLMGETVLNESAVKSLADLPSLDVLRAQILGLLNAPASQLVGVVAGGVRQLVNVFNAYAEEGQKEEASVEE